MICNYCGNEVSDGLIFCSYCNAQIYNPQQANQGYVQPTYNVQQTQQQYNTVQPEPMYSPQQPTQGYVPAKKPVNNGGAKIDFNKLIKDKRFLIAVAVVLLLLLVALGGGKKEVIDLQEYVTFRYEGVEGHGRYVCSLKYSELYEDIAEIIADECGSDNYDALYEGALACGEFVDSARESIMCSRDRDLSNGDKVTAKINIDKDALKEYNIEFKNLEVSDKVEGLVEGEVINPFETIDVYVVKNIKDGSYEVRYDRLDPNDTKNYEFYIADISDGKFTIKINEKYLRMHAENGTILEPTSITMDANDYFQQIEDIDDVSEEVINNGNEYVINTVCAEEGMNPADFNLYAYAAATWPDESRLYFIYTHKEDIDGSYGGYCLEEALINNFTGEVKHYNAFDISQNSDVPNMAQFRVVGE